MVSPFISYSPGAARDISSQRSSSASQWRGQTFVIFSLSLFITERIDGHQSIEILEERTQTRLTYR